MELRDIEIFLTLAEELHFGRTAERLHISPPRVSQTIAKQERRIGASLFERTSRKVTLTPLGEQLRDDLQAGYRRILEGVESARDSARGGPEVLTFGVLGPMWQEISPITALFRSRHPNVELRMREVRMDDPFGLLREREVDVALLWLPVEETDLTVGPVTFTEPIVLAVGRTHPLATRSSVSLTELPAHNVLPSGLPIPEYWESAVSPVPGGASPRTREEVMWAVTSGRGRRLRLRAGHQVPRTRRRRLRPDRRTTDDALGPGTPLRTNHPAGRRVLPNRGRTRPVGTGHRARTRQATPAPLGRLTR